MSYRTKNLLSIGNDAKTVKGLKKGILTGVMYLAPHAISGYQVCPKASEGCKAACLYTSGHGRFTNTQIARINKTKWFFEDRESFMATLVKNVESLIRKAEGKGLTPAIRLNGTSDIAWEKIACVRDGVQYRSIIEAFSEIQWYDYTKILGRKKALSLPNYHLTFSLAENNDADAAKALEQGYNLAVVMRLGRNDAKPETWSGFPVVDGDETDVRFLDPKGGTVVALFAKGDAKKDTSGFVRDPEGGLNVRATSIPIKLAA